MSPNETSQTELEPDTGSFPCKSGLFLLPSLLSALLGPNDPLALSTVLSHPCLVEQRAGQVSRRRTRTSVAWLDLPKGRKILLDTQSPSGESSIEVTTDTWTKDVTSHSYSADGCGKLRRERLGSILALTG